MSTNESTAIEIVFAHSESACVVDRLHNAKARKGERLGGAHDLELLTPTAPVPAQEDIPGFAQVREYLLASKAESTLRGYQSDWRDFCAWCESRGGLSPLPAAADIVAAYIAECAVHLKPGSIQRRLNAIAEAHKAAGLDSRRYK